ncbi:Lipase-like protein [Ilyonectria robusta]
MAASDSNSTPVSSIDVELKAYDPTERLLGADDSDNSLDSSSIASDDFHSESIAKTARPSPRRNRLLWIVLTTVIALALLAFGFVLGVSFGLRKSNDGLGNGLGFNSTLGDGGFNSTLGGGGLDDDTHDDTQDDPHDDTHDDTHDGLDDQVDDQVDDGLGPGPTVDLDYSRYKGNYISNGIHEFVGMRYARPPTGDLRWRAPVNPEHTTETQSAKKFRTICLATNHKLGGTVSGEDCLFVNVWSPNVTADAKLPVMVFIQGGGYTLLARPWINGSEIIETSGQNMVLVTFHYRTGLFGFLAGADVKNDGNLNAGLLDQRFVFEWVQRHISKFGGDPNHVVIQGSSAGGGSVALQLAANGGRDDGLFIGAIMESPFLPSQRSISDLEFQYDHVVSSAGCNDTANKMQCLRGKTLEELQGINLSWELPGRTNKPLFYFGPCTDGEFLRDTPYAMYDRGAFVKVPVLIGHCTDGMSLSQ